VNLASDSLTPHTNVVTGSATDDDGTEATDTGTATVTFDDVLPDVSITKTANPTSVPETGADVEFTIVVTNHSLEKVKIDSLVDSDFDLATYCSDAVGTELAHNETYTCTFTAFVSGDFESGVAHVNTATVTASDNDGNSDEASDDATVTFTDITAQIDVEKLVKVSGGSFIDADHPTGPFATEGSAVEFKFVVTNTGTATLTNIALTDSDFALGTCTIPASLAPGASFECVISVTAMMGQHTDTATASGSFTDGAGNVESDSDTDDANYYGMDRHQPSISINSLSININSTRTTVNGQFNITDESEGGNQPDGFLIALTNYGVRWEQRTSKPTASWAPVNPTNGCTYTIVSVDKQQVAGWQSGDPIIFDESVTIGYTCSFGSSQLIKGGVLRGTAYAEIFNRTGMVFTYSSTKSIPK
jgi:uncharacterized repeat protein (TIGR01451 family)